MKKLITILLFHLHFMVVLGQNAKGQIEISIPANPWTYAMSKSYLVQYEQFLSAKHSLVVTTGYQGVNFLQAYFSKSELSGYRLDFGMRSYYKPEQLKVFRPYLGANLALERTSLNLRPELGIPADSLQAKGISIGPEINMGFKLVFWKRLVLTHTLGMRYYVSTMNTKKLTYNQQYWAYNDWDNARLKWEDNRAADVDFPGGGFYPVAFLNLGVVLKL